MARRVPRPQGRPQTKLIAFSPGRRVLADAVPDDGDLNQNDILARQQLELELLASSAATTSPDSRLSSSSSSRSYSSSSSSRILSQSSWSVPVSTEEEIEEDLNEDLSPRGSRITTGRHWRFILTLILSIMIVVAYFTIRNLISRGVSDEILIRFQRPIENGFGWANRRMIYLSQFDPSLANNTLCVPTLCPSTLSFLYHPNPYAVLGLPLPSYAYAPPSKKEMQRAYRTLAMLYHPDKSASYLSPEIATHIMAIYTSAMEILLDPEAKNDFEKQWLRGSGSRTVEELSRAEDLEKFGKVDTWSVIKEIQVGDLRKLRFRAL